MRRTRCLLAISLLAAAAGVVGCGEDDSGYERRWQPLAVVDDPLPRQPGTQPANDPQQTPGGLLPENGDVPAGADEFSVFQPLEAPDVCFECHGGFNRYSSPDFAWHGSMMAQAARDPIFFAALTVANQDSIYLANRPNGADMCVRCHFPKGWLEGRSDPTNASAFEGFDYDGVQCDFCHRKVDPFYELQRTTGRPGEPPPSENPSYWDEINESIDYDTRSWVSANPAPLEPDDKWLPYPNDLGLPPDTDHAAGPTYSMDYDITSHLKLFTGGEFYAEDLPVTYPRYNENGSGQYYFDWVNWDDKRGPKDDAVPEYHDPQYSRYHKSKYFCETCHDVSNPNLLNISYANLRRDDASGVVLPSESLPAYSYFHSERTFSEFLLSAYGANEQGAPGMGAFSEVTPDGNVRMCQDCHQRELSGTHCDDETGKIRPDESEAHQDGDPVHDFSGGNMWVPWVLGSALRNETPQDKVNHNLLVGRPEALTMDPLYGTVGEFPTESMDALFASSERARRTLQTAAEIQDLTVEGQTVSFRIQNNTAHKLITGYQEGRRMFLNLVATDGAGNRYEINPYDYKAGTLKGLSFPYKDTTGKLPSPQKLDRQTEEYRDGLVYEALSSSFYSGEENSLHFVLNTDRFKDNRIPPPGFNAAQATVRLAEPRLDGAPRLDLYSAAEYAGGYDDVSVTLPFAPTDVEVNLYYQTTSREYIEFLRNEINQQGTLPQKSPSNPAWRGYIAQRDSFFAQLDDWGNTIWDLWKNNKDVESAKPLLMARATYPEAETPVPAPTDLTVTVGEPDATTGDVPITVSWTGVESADGYQLAYYLGITPNNVWDFYGSPQFNLIAWLDAGTTSYTVTETAQDNPQKFCYTVRAFQDSALYPNRGPDRLFSDPAEPAGDASICVVIDASTAPAARPATERAGKPPKRTASR